MFVKLEPLETCPQLLEMELGNRESRVAAKLFQDFLLSPVGIGWTALLPEDLSRETSNAMAESL